MTQDQIKAKLPPPLTGAKIMPDVISCDHIIGVDSRGVLISDPVKMAKYGGIGFTFCPICGSRLEVSQ